jgi:lipopolysaccharide transport system ATP-binding protein
VSAISVQHVSKEFKLGVSQPGYRTVKELFQRPRAKRHTRPETFHALQDVSFEVAPGEVLGVIGRNGAGKSTLLKILARVLRPSRGRVELHGRLGSLLEVGAGFHPELTGRENIFLNAAILGMSRGEIVRKLEEIIDFSGCAKYLDEPVRHYSSGMYMRLAFAVAAHIEPEILLIDEVLAVGDADFERKCLQKIEQVGKRGQTVLLVSHNIQTVLRLCPRALLLDQGQVVEVGPSAAVTARYLNIGGANRGVRRYAEGPYAPGDSVVRLRGVRVRSRDGETLPSVDIGEEFGIEIEFEVREAGVALFPSFLIRNEWWPALWCTDVGSEWHGRPRPSGLFREVAWIPAHLLSAGAMRVTAGMHSFRPYAVHFVEPDAVSFQAMETAGGARGGYTGYIESGVRPLLHWTVEHSKS